jgi:hypothetical protein
LIAVRLLSAFGTLEPGFASLMLSAVINTACDGGPAHPPGSGDINNALAAVTGIGVRDEIEGMRNIDPIWRDPELARGLAMARRRLICVPFFEPATGNSHTEDLSYDGEVLRGACNFSTGVRRRQATGVGLSA